MEGGDALASGRVVEGKAKSALEEFAESGSAKNVVAAGAGPVCRRGAHRVPRRGAGVGGEQRQVKKW